VFYNKLQGFDANGNIYTADKLPALIASNQAQRASLAKSGAPQVQLDALDGIIIRPFATVLQFNTCSVFEQGSSNIGLDIRFGSLTTPAN
jgi:hypothetical protein